MKYLKLAIEVICLILFLVSFGMLAEVFSKGFEEGLDYAGVSLVFAWFLIGTISATVLTLGVDYFE